MTAATLSHLPLTAGSAVASSIGRGGLWALGSLLRGGYWAVAQFMRAPVTITAVAAMAGLSVLAGSNALYFQPSRHPAPWFFAAPRQLAPGSTPIIRPVIPATRPRFQPASLDAQTTGSVGGQPAVEPIGNDDVAMVQRKLASLNLFDGTADGLFGRRTASAIKAFEIHAGLNPRGQLTRETMATIMAAPLPGSQALPAVQPMTVAQPLPATEPLPAAPPTVAAAPAPVPAAVTPQPVQVAVTMQLPAVATKPVPLAAPRSLPQATPQIATADVTPQSSSTFDDNSQPSPPVPARLASNQPIGRVVPSGDDLLNAAGDTAAGAFDSVASMVSDVANGHNRVALPQRTIPATRPIPTPVTTIAQNDAAAGDTTVVAMNNPPARTQPAPVAVASIDTSAMNPAQKLAAQIGTLPPEATPSNATPPATTSGGGDLVGSTDPVLITKIQRGLASLGFLGQKIDGVPGEGTAKAIRNFEVFYDYKVTGLATPQLLDLLVQHGAVI